MPTPSTSASVASTRSEGDDRPRSIWLRKPIDRSVRSAIVSSDSLCSRRRSRMRWPTARSIAGSAGLVAAFAFGLRAVFAAAALALVLGAGFLILLPPLTSACFLHVHENRLQCRG